MRTLRCLSQHQEPNVHLDTYKPTPSVSWSMVRGKAQILCPETTGLLRVTSGRAWVSSRLATELAPLRWCPEIKPGDILIGPGKGLAVDAKKRVLIESWPVGRSNSTHLIWEDAKTRKSNCRWQDAVVQSASGVVRGAKQFAVALYWIARGQVNYMDYPNCGRGTVGTAPEAKSP